VPFWQISIVRRAGLTAAIEPSGVLGDNAVLMEAADAASWVTAGQSPPVHQYRGVPKGSLVVEA